MSVHSDRRSSWLLFICLLCLFTAYALLLDSFLRHGCRMSQCCHPRTGFPDLRCRCRASLLLSSPLLLPFLSSPSSPPLPLLPTPSLYAFSLALIPPLPGLSNPLPCILRAMRLQRPPSDWPREDAVNGLSPIGTADPGPSRPITGPGGPGCR